MTSADPPDGSAPHVIVGDVAAPELSEADRHHLVRVRRLRIGDALTVTDGAGSWRHCVLGDDGSLSGAGDIVHVPRPAPEIAVAFALTKGDKPDWTVQKLTELGVDRIIPFRAERSVVRWDEAKARANHERMESIARSAVEQSHRVWLPVVEEVTDVASLAARGAVRADRSADRRFDGWRDLGGGDGAGVPAVSIPAVVAVGPEGGWSDDERELLPRAMGLGQHVLRAETAALAAAVVLGLERDGLSRP